MTFARIVFNGPAFIGWGLAVAAIALGYSLYGWPGVFLAFTITVFWLLLQFSRALRVMRAAATNPVALVESALMAHTRIHRGMKMLQVLHETKSLGQRLPHPSPGAHESWEWRDRGGDALVVDFAHGRCMGTALVRGAETTHPSSAGGTSAAEPASLPAP